MTQQDYDQQMEETQRKQAEFERLKQQVKDAPEIYQWQIQVNAAGGGKLGWYIINGMAISMAIIGLFVGWLMINGDDWTGFWVVGGMGLFMAFFFRFLWMADNLYNYHLTEKGIYYTEQQAIPEIAYSVVRGSAWVGVAVCVVAAALVGPIAFVGAGAFALMSFSMAKFSPNITSSGIYFSGSYSILHLKDQEVIQLFNDNREVYGVGIIYCSPENKRHLFELFKSLLPNTEIIEIKKIVSFLIIEKIPRINRLPLSQLQITRTPISNGAINMAGTPVLVNEQNGRWQRIEKDKRHLLRYSVAAGGTDQAIVTLLLRMPLYLWPATHKEAPDAACHLLYGTYGSTEGIMNLTVLDAETNTKSTRTMVVTV